MTSTSYAVSAGTTRIPVPLVAWLVAAIALFAVYVLVQENGALLSDSAAQYLHEVTHDARHALGVPCH